MTATLRPGMLLQTHCDYWTYVLDPPMRPLQKELHGSLTIAQKNHKLDVEFPVKANGLIQIQPRQWEQAAVPVQGHAHQLAGLEPVIPRKIAGTISKNQPGELW